ncbi:MAG: AbrB/MazE/SpoVT family DNA-binding domain-containing protein [Terriglobia bacterium]
MTVRRSESIAASIGRVGKRRQVVIPKRFCEDLGLREGDFVEVRSNNGTVVIRPKRLVDPDDLLTRAEARIVHKGEGDLRRGDYVTLAQLRHELGRPIIKNRSKTA